MLCTCGLGCEYCYLRKEITQKISLGDLIKFLQKFEKYCVEYNFLVDINFMGGDVWFHPEISEIIEYAYNLWFVNHINLAVNSMWSSEGRMCVQKFKDKIFCVQFNLSLLEECYEDLFFLQKEGIRSAVKIVLTKQQNIKREIRIVQRLSFLIPELLIFIDRLCPQTVEECKYALSTVEFQETITMLTKLFKHFYTEDPLAKTFLMLIKQKRVNDLGKNELHGCAIPGGGISIYPDGEIKLCSRISSFDTGFNIQNFDLLKYLGKFDYIRERRTSKCKKCKFFILCKGGCPATSYIKNNGFSRDLHCLKYD